MNAAWHAQHVMPKNATLAARVAWHRAHQKHCACRPIPATVLAATKAGTAKPARKPSSKGSSGKKA